MLINKDSPLRNIPIVLNRRQLLFIEGIRLTVETADLAYRRLLATLPILSKHLNNLDPDNPSTVSVMLDAWAVVDSLHRLRGLIDNLPGFKGKKKSPTIRAFLDSTQKVAALRNTVQHLGTEISDAVDDSNWTVFGTLSWGLVEPAKNEVLACFYLPGAPTGLHPIINPLSRRVWHLPLDMVTLERSGISVCLSDAMRRVEALVAAMEKTLAEAFSQQVPAEHQGKTHGADIVVSLVIAVGPEQIVPEGTLDPDPEPGPDASYGDEADDEQASNVSL
jgi:hypothetical protein